MTMRASRAAVIVTILCGATGVSSAGTYSIVLDPRTTPIAGVTDPLDGPTDARWARFPDGRVEVFADTNYITPQFGSNLTVRVDRDYNVRSAMEFNLDVLPDDERVVNATLVVDAININVNTLVNLGTVRHLDSSRAVGDPGATWTYDELAGGAVIGNLGPSLQSPTITERYDVTAAVAADHRANARYSPFSLVEDPNRRFTGTVQFRSEDFLMIGSRPELIVVTAPPFPVLFDVTPLGGTRYRYDYTIVNEVSRPLRLIDLEFDPRLYREDTLSITSVPALAANWNELILNSGESVPPVVTLAAPGGGVLAGQRVAGFSVEFDWLGTGQPGSQGITVFDAATFNELYRTTTIVLLPVASHRSHGPQSGVSTRVVGLDEQPKE